MPDFVRIPTRVAEAFGGALGTLVLGGLMLGAVPATAQKMTAAEIAAAPACAALPAGVDRMICQCPAGGAAGTVWGSGPYTADSDICAAARHSGVIGAAGGPLVMTRRPGQDAYEGSTRNGVTTQGWGSYGDSFAISAVGGKGVKSGPAQPVAANGPACAAFPVGEARYDCTCGPAASNGSVWGSGPYTADSDLCTAARHAGVIGAAGGGITALAVTGLESYRGSEAGGVVTSDWDAYGDSFVFDRN